MKQHIQGIVIGAVTTLGLLGGVTAIASPTAISRSIDVFFGNYKVYVDGTLLEATDTQGNRLEPFAYNGYMYVPAEEIALAFGKGVNWVQNTGTLYLGEQPGLVQYMTDILPAYQASESSYKEYSAAKNGLEESFELGGVKYFDGLVIQAPYAKADNWAVYNLNNQYSSLSGILCHVDGTTVEMDQRYKPKLQVFCDGNLKVEYDLSSDMPPTDISIDVIGVTQLKLVVTQAGLLPGPFYGIGNPVLK
ncbi:MAG: NPCBM/NEW2 domain-containing protein [Clostridiales bacterium]|jgi:hypothetical protein|nr:NPCBM/NEW2 domain-containing protein [Clostridiales bacterium]